MKYQVMPDLTPIEYEALKADIAERGVLVAVEVDETGAILDGHHRVKAWEELRHEGMNLAKYSTMTRAGLTEEQKRNHARSLNVLRRHLTAEQRKAVTMAMEKDGAEIPEIAAAMGVSERTVRRDLDADSTLTNVKVEKKKGKDGKNRPTKYKKSKPAATTPGLFKPGEDVKVETPTQAKRAEKEAKREERRQENAVKVATAPDAIPADAKFATILIDPPWDWGDEGDVNQMGRAKPDYSTLTIDQLEVLPVGDLADVDCHIYMWITNRSLPKGFCLLERWGFRYVTCVTWVKPSFGMGNYFRGQTEHILFGVKGSQPLRRHDASTVFSASRGPNGHSSKPPEVYDLIESCSPGPYLEMFSRCERAGWAMWGESNGN